MLCFYDLRSDMEEGDCSYTISSMWSIALRFVDLEKCSIGIIRRTLYFLSTRTQYLPSQLPPTQLPPKRDRCLRYQSPRKTAHASLHPKHQRHQPCIPQSPMPPHITSTKPLPNPINIPHQPYRRNVRPRPSSAGTPQEPTHQSSNIQRVERQRHDAGHQPSSTLREHLRRED